VRLRFWLPRTAQPRYICRICGQPFYEGERVAWESHAVKCARDNHDALVAEMHTRRPPALFQAADKEYEKWVREHGRAG